MKNNISLMKTVLQLKLIVILLLVPMIAAMGSSLEKEKDELLLKIKSSYTKICNVDDSFLSSIGTVVNIFNRNIDNLAGDRKILTFSKLSYSNETIFSNFSQSQSTSDQGVKNREKKVVAMEKKLKSVIHLRSYTKAARTEANLRWIEAQKKHELKKWISKLKETLYFIDNNLYPLADSAVQKRNKIYDEVEKMKNL